MAGNRLIAAARRRIRGCRAGWTLLLLTTVTLRGDQTPLRLGFSSTFFHDINENDARASLKAMAAVISRERNLPADPEPHLYQGTSAMAAAIREGTVNGVSVTTEEYWLLRQTVGFKGLLLSTFDGKPDESYLIIVHRDSPIHALADLRGKEVAIQRSPRMSLANVWVEVELAKAGLPALTRFTLRVTATSKPSKVILPVYFHQVDAAIVSERTFGTLCELNPQMGRELRIMARSPSYVPCGFALTDAMSDEAREHWLYELTSLDRSPLGEQVLTIFQSAHVRPFAETVLENALQLMDEYQRRCPEASAARIAELRTGRGDLAAR